MTINIPSINVPLTDSRGRISPIWHEFLRSFVATSVDGTISAENVTGTVTAGNGLIGGGVGDVTIAVGAGSGLAVNANDVSVDIAGQTHVQAVLDDEVMIADISDNNAIRKVTVRDIAVLGAIPGGINTEIQFNSDGIFEGDSGFTTDGAGSLNIVGDLDVDNINLDGNTISSTDTNGNVVIDPNGTGYLDVNSDAKFVDANGDMTISGATFSTDSSSDVFTFTVPAGASTPHYLFTQSGAGSSDMPFNIEGTLASAELFIENNANGGGSTLPESRIKLASEGTTYWTLGLTSESTSRGFTLGTTGLNTNNVFLIDATNRYFTHQTSTMRTTTASITASTTQTQGQQALTSDINEVSACANANDVVTLPSAVAGRHCLVINNGANTLQVFPASGDNLGAGVDTSTTIASGSRKWFVAFDSTNYEPVI